MRTVGLFLIAFLSFVAAPSAQVPRISILVDPQHGY